MCAEGRPETVHGNARVFAGHLSDAYLTRKDVGQPGYTVVVWRGGRHIADATELKEEEASTYFGEVLRVARAVERHYRPIKMNLEMLGNTLPHLHTHVVPRFLDDGAPGFPPLFMSRERDDEPIPEERYLRDVRALRALLT